MAGIRIIGGKWRSRRIEPPPTGRTRPMPDRVKGSIFDILGTRWRTPGMVPEYGVADLFAGSGSLGLEAISRGAARCVFIERDRRALQVLQRNLSVLDACSQARAISADAWRRSLGELIADDGPFGLVLLDPPYADARDWSPGAKMPRLLRWLIRDPSLAEEAVVVLHHERVVRFEPRRGDGWVITDRREYGSTAISFLAAGTAAPADR